MKEGLIPSLRLELDRLNAQTTFRMSRQVNEDALRAVGEGKS